MVEVQSLVQEKNRAGRNADVGGGMGFVGIRMYSVTDTVSLRDQQNIQVEREPAVLWKVRPPWEESEVLVQEVRIHLRKDGHGESIKNRRGNLPRLDSWVQPKLLAERKRYLWKRPNDQVAREIPDGQDHAVEPRN